MASLEATLEVAGQRYPLVHATFGVSQPTGRRGRVATKVRYSVVELALDVPTNDQLLAWAADPAKRQAASLTFSDAATGSALETLSLGAAYCVGYREEFVAGLDGDGAYRCALVLSDPDGFTMKAGGPGAAFVAAAAREYAAPMATAAEVIPAATEALTKQQRYDARMGLMQQARTKLTTVTDEPAQTALTRLERNNVAVERAKLSAHVYHSDEVPPVAEPEGWHMLSGEELADKGVSPEMLLDPASGFKAALYQSSFERPPKLVIAFAGTEDKKDIIADLRQGIGLKEKQYNEAMDLAKAVAKEVDPLDIETTGHSLGGGLASAATVVTGTKGYTFNAAGLHVNTVKRAPYEVSRAVMREQGALIDAYRSTSDPLNNAQKAAVVTRGFVLPKALGISRPVAPAAAWQHKWSELVKGNPLKAATAMALHGHGISPQMVDHIEAEKDEDTGTLTSFLAP